MIKVLLADDHEVLLDGLQLLLSEEPDIECVGTVHDGRAVLRFVQNQPVDVILMDINMPHLNGIETCKAVLKSNPEIKVLALTMFNKGSFIQQMLKAGAKGYLLKNTQKEELVKSIKTVHAGSTYLGEGASAVLMDSLMNKSAPTAFIPELTRREQQVLQLIACEFTTAEISEQLHISLHTVETHRRHLLSKLGARNSVGLVRIAFEKGLLG